MKKLFVAVVIALLVGAAAGMAWAAAGEVTLAWDPNSETDLAGYRIHWGTATGTYTQHVDVGNVVQYTVKNLTLGTTYFFAATAYNASGLESGYSNEISAKIATFPAVPRNMKAVKVIVTLP
jgi:hypothetical protein